MIRMLGARPRPLLNEDNVAVAPGDIPMTPPKLTAATPTRLRRRASIWGALVAVAAIGSLAAWLVGPSLMIDPHRIVDWQRHGFLEPVSQTTPSSRTIEVFVARWPTEFGHEDDSWLDQRVIETPMTVTITLSTSEAYESLPWQRGFFDTGGWVTVHLGAPLGDRLLFDGSGFPPQRRA
jgi:hypothetical protein